MEQTLRQRPSLLFHARPHGGVLGGSGHPQDVFRSHQVGAQNDRGEHGVSPSTGCVHSGPLTMASNPARDPQPTTRNTRISSNGWYRMEVSRLAKRSVATILGYGEPCVLSVLGVQLPACPRF